MRSLWVCTASANQPDHSLWLRSAIQDASITDGQSQHFSDMIPNRMIQGNTFPNPVPSQKKGSSSLRRTLFIIIRAISTQKPIDNPVYVFLDRKRSEGKHYYSYMTAAAAKFLRIYYAKVNEVLNEKGTSMCT